MGNEMKNFFEPTNITPLPQLLYIGNLLNVNTRKE